MNVRELFKRERSSFVALLLISFVHSDKAHKTFFLVKILPTTTGSQRTKESDLSEPVREERPLPAACRALPMLLRMVV